MNVEPAASTAGAAGAGGDCHASITYAPVSPFSRV
jgi:hypothetical protein